MERNGLEFERMEQWRQITKASILVAIWGFVSGAISAIFMYSLVLATRKRLITPIYTISAIHEQ